MALFSLALREGKKSKPGITVAFWYRRLFSPRKAEHSSKKG